MLFNHHSESKNENDDTILRQLHRKTFGTISTEQGKSRNGTKLCKKKILRSDMIESNFR